MPCGTLQFRSIWISAFNPPTTVIKFWLCQLSVFFSTGVTTCLRLTHSSLSSAAQGYAVSLCGLLDAFGFGRLCFVLNRKAGHLVGTVRSTVDQMSCLDFCLDASSGSHSTIIIHFFLPRSGSFFLFEVIILA